MSKQELFVIALFRLQTFHTGLPKLSLKPRRLAKCNRMLRMVYGAYECSLYASSVAPCFQLNMILIYEEQIWNRRGKVVKECSEVVYIWHCLSINMSDSIFMTVLPEYPKGEIRRDVRMSSWNTFISNLVCKTVPHWETDICFVKIRKSNHIRVRCCLNVMKFMFAIYCRLIGTVVHFAILYTKYLTLLIFS